MSLDDDAIRVEPIALRTFEEVEAFVEGLYGLAFEKWPETAPVSVERESSKLCADETLARWREFLSLVEDKGLTATQIAEAKGIKVKAARNILCNARKARREGRI